MAGPATAETKERLYFDPNIRQFDDTVTWLAEVLDGQMKSEFTYNFDGEDLIARDGSRLDKIFTDSVSDAEAKALHDPKYQFELRRRKTELEEYQDILQMAKGSTPHNTIVVVSDFPEEVDRLGRHFGGYNVSRRQTMLRVITKNPDSTITMTSQTLDKSNRQALEAIYGFFGASPKRGELLGQRIHANIDPKSASGISDTLTRVYDNSLSTQYGGQWFAGRSGDDRRNTMHFALQQTDLIDFYLAGDQDETSMYNLSASISARFEGRSSDMSVLGNVVYLDDKSRLYAEMQYQGDLARSEGKSFNGCGGTLSADVEMSALGYGERNMQQSNDGPDGKGPLKFKCKNGHQNTRPLGKLIPCCTTCGVSVKC